MIQPKNLSWYLRTGRSLSKDRDTDIMYLLEINKLNTEKKFWTRFFTGNPIEITEITDDIANAAIVALDKENATKIDEIKTNEEIRSEEMETNKLLNITNSDVATDQKIKDISLQQSVSVKQDTANIEAKPAATEETQPNNITDSLYYNITDTISSAAKNITSNASDIYTAASNATSNITNAVSGVASNITDTVSKWIWGDAKKEEAVEKKDDAVEAQPQYDDKK